MSIVLLLMVVLVQATIALADNFTSSLQQATNLYKKGKYEEAWASMYKARIELLNKAPLSIRNIHLITEKPQGFGLYTPRTASGYKVGETVIVYMEPFGFTVLQKDGFYEWNMEVEFLLVDSKGKILGGERIPYAIQSRSFNDGAFIFLELTIKPPGEYTVDVIVKDFFSHKEATTNIEFEVMPKPSSGSWFW
jgi:hypothetical protein